MTVDICLPVFNEQEIIKQNVSKFFNGRVKEIAVDWQENRHKKRKNKVTILKDGIFSLINFFNLKKRIKKLNKIKIGE